MNKRIYKLFSTIGAVVLALGMMTMGVLAATSHTLGVSTTVSFTASYIGGSITGDVAGVNGANSYSASFDETTTSTLAPWNVGQNLVVQDTNGIAKDVVYTINVTNTTFGAKMNIAMSNVACGTSLQLKSVTLGDLAWAPTDSVYSTSINSSATIVLTFDVINDSTSFVGGTTYGAGIGFIGFNIDLTRGGEREIIPTLTITDNYVGDEPTGFNVTLNSVEVAYYYTSGSSCLNLNDFSIGDTLTIEIMLMYSASGAKFDDTGYLYQSNNPSAHVTPITTAEHWITYSNITITGNIYIVFHAVACFLPDTLVKTESGYKNIQDIEVGEKVWTLNEWAQNMELKTVNFVHKNYYENSIVNLSFGDIIVRSTSGHTYLTEDGTWVAGKDLVVGQKIKTYSGLQTITAKTTEQYSGYVYNLSIEDNHNFMVTGVDLIVHNAPSPCV